VTAPFAGVYDWLNTENFCGSGAGYDSVSGLESRFVSSGVPWRNTAIVQYVKSGKKDFASLFQQGAIPANFSYTGGWAELYAQSFAYAGYAIGQTISTSLMPRMNQLLQNGYFACTLDWAYEISVGDVQPPSPVPDLPSPMSGTCSDAVQSWYPAVLGYPNF
jgi:hypothetical protein